ncbi:MAG: TIGR03084 family metal-binding protein [Actinomycetota bacterium]
MDITDVRRDLQAEQQALDEIVAPLRPEQWHLPTPSPRWTIADQIGHLTYFDRTAAQAIVDPDEFTRGVERILESADDADPDAFTLNEFRALDAEPLLAAWRAGRQSLADASAGLADGDRVVWYGPSMGAKSFLTARLMEAWAHGQDIVDALAAAGIDADREATDRLRHIAQLGYITRGWTYANRGLDVPDVPVRVALTSPTGDTWKFGPDADSDPPPESIEGPALHFCLVTTQRRHVDDTDLVVTGASARDWMEKAQLFAGPPTDGPAATT